MRRRNLSIGLIALLTLAIWPLFLSGETGAFASPTSPLCTPLPGYEDLPCRPLPPQLRPTEPAAAESAAPEPAVPEPPMPIMWTYVGEWWTGPETSCALYSDGHLYRLDCP